MNLGVCVPWALRQQALELGYDYVELPLVSTVELAERGEEDAEALREQLAQVPKYNILLPGWVELLGDTSDAALSEYLHGAFGWIAAEGAPTRPIVLGSGRSRNRPEDLPYEEAFERLVERVRLIGELAAEYKLQIVFEPLNQLETNMIHTLTEGARLVEAVGLPNVGLIADYYHMLMEEESLEVLNKGYPIWHAHIALDKSRAYPRSLTPGLKQFLDQLLASGYRGDVSIEAVGTLTDEVLLASLASLRAWQAEQA